MNKEQLAYEKGYRVTKDGCLIGLRRRRIGSINNEGYERTTILNNNNKKLYIQTHRLQAYQKYGDKLFQDGIVVRHLNGNALDNSWNNIAIGTQRDNIMDIPKEKRKRDTSKGNKASIKYPKEFVLKLREEYKVIKNYNKLGRKYHMYPTVIWQLINKRKVFKDA